MVTSSLFTWEKKQSSFDGHGKVSALFETEKIQQSIGISKQ
jgi:hypothetical protein